MFLEPLCCPTVLVVRCLSSGDVLKLPHHQNKICHHYFIITKIKATLLNVITNTGVAPSKTPAPAILRRLGTVVAVAAVGASEVVVAAVAARLEASALA